MGLVLCYGAIAHIHPYVYSTEPYLLQLSLHIFVRGENLTLHGIQGTLINNCLSQ